MLNISGPPVVPPPQRSEDSAFVLRLNQRIVAEVLQISGDNVTLAVEGVRFVAKLTSAEQAAALQEHRVAHFIVRDINASQVMIQLAAPGAPGGGVAFATQDLARALLSQMGLPDNESNLLLLRVMLAHGLAADATAFGEIELVLNQLGGWGAREAQAAAALKAAGLPLSAGTLALVLGAEPETTPAYAHLMSLLKGLSARQVSPQAAAALGQALAGLQDAALQWSGSSSAMAESLRQVVKLLGRSVEAGLAARLENASTNPLAPQVGQGLLNLLALRRDLARSGPREVVQAIDRYLDALRLQNLQSSEREAAPGRNEWIHLRLPLQLPPAAGSDNLRPVYREASLRIASRRKGETRQVTANFARFVITIDLDEQAALEVDLSLVEKKVGMQVLAASNELCTLAKEELPGLTRGLNELGFALHTSRFETGMPRRPLAVNEMEISPTKFLAVDLEI